MKLKTILATLAITFLASLAFASTAGTIVTKSGAKFFEPTQQDFNCCSQAIVDQQDAYYTAKEAGDYEQAVDNALFYWTRAWAHFNKGIDTITKSGAFGSKDKLNEAISYMDLASADALKAKEKGSGVEQADRILGLVAKNKSRFEAQLKYLKLQDAKRGLKSE